jgi:hypothetical protein
MVNRKKVDTRFPRVDHLKHSVDRLFHGHASVVAFGDVCGLPCWQLAGMAAVASKGRENTSSSTKDRGVAQIVFCVY